MKCCKFISIIAGFFAITVLTSATSLATTSNIEKFMSKKKAAVSTKKKPVETRLARTGSPVPADLLIKKTFGNKASAFEMTSVTPLIPVPVLPPGGASGTTNPSVGITIRGQSTCAQPHYLSPNRLDWWNNNPPQTGFFTLDFLCEFSGALAVVSGGNTSLISNSDLQNSGFRVIPWQIADVGKSINEVSGTHFSVRNQPGLSRPALREYNPRNSSNLFVVLINEPEDQTLISNLGPNEIRPSLWFDFTLPQRAVGLEYGYQILNNDRSEHIDKRAVQLIAYDSQGNEIVRSYGRDEIEGISLGSRLAPNRLDHMIGVRDMFGRIKSVELRFTFDRADQPEGQQGNAVREAQVVSRVWTEAFPPAAVYQGQAGVQMNYQPSENSTGEIGHKKNFSERFGHEPGPMSIQLPYRFDRALVFLRGFRFEYLDFTPRPVKEMAVGISQNETNFNLIENGSGNNFSYTPRYIRVVPTGVFDSAERPEPAYVVTAYYTVLGWDSQQADINFISGSNSTSSVNAAFRQTISVNDQCCGPMAGVFHNITLSSTEPVEVNELSIRAGRQDIQDTLFRNPNGPIWWHIDTVFDREDEDVVYFRNTYGIILTGSSLKLGPDDFPGRDPNATSSAFQQGTPFFLPPSGSRPDSNEYRFSVQATRDFMHFSWPVLADMGFLALNRFSVSLSEEPISELDIELHAANFDGKVIDWQIGTGINTLAPIGNQSRERFVFGEPLFIGISRKSESN